MKKMIAFCAALTLAASVFASGAKEKVEVDSELEAMVEMVSVKGGSFSMGAADGEEDEYPVHSVSVDSFKMSKTEVTQELYKKVTGKNPSYFKGEKLPVECVSWLDAVIFCNELSEKMGLTPCYSKNGDFDITHWLSSEGITCNFNANGYRLPTEAEWEFAARGGENGDKFLYSGSDNIDEVAWYQANCEGETHEVATKTPNSLGLFDMSGNAWEWCWDNYDPKFYLDGSSRNTKGPSSGNGTKVLRGGSRASTYGDGSGVCRVSNRHSSKADERYYLNGFRVVCAE